MDRISIEKTFSTRRNGRKLLALSLLSLSLGYSGAGVAEVWSDVRDNVFTNNGVVNCTECHSYTKTITTFNSSDPASRHSAPDGVNFDGTTDLNAYNAATGTLAFPGTGGADTTWNDNTEDRIYERASNYVTSGYMPMNPINGADFTDHTNLSGARMTTLLNWAVQGAPYAAASATTSAASSISKTGATLNSTIDTNVHSGTAVPGTYYYEYEEEVAGAIGSYDFSTTPVSRSSTSSTTSTGVAISGLRCGTQYNFRAVATNGNGTANGSNTTFTTSACTDPVVAGVTIVADATSQVATEEVNADFALTVTNVDPGSLQWSKTNSVNGGTVTLISPTSTAFNGSATVRYLSATDYFGSDSFTVTVNNMNSGTSRTITFNMTVSNVNDQPSITSVAPASGTEDTLYNYQVVVDDPDDAFGAGLSIALSNQPLGMTVDPNTGLISWTPTNGTTTSGLVTVSVDDGHENGTVQVTQDFTVAVTATNDPPTITSTAGTTATEDVQYSYQVVVNDVDDTNNGADISFTLSGEPLGMTVSSTGLITWTPLEGVTTSGAVTVTVEDGNEDLSTPTLGNNGQESFTVAVTSVNDAPSITSSVPVLSFTEEDTFSYQITASDSDDAGIGTELTASLTQNPAGMTVNATGLVSWVIPRTAIFANSIDVTVQIADGGEDGALPDQQSFTLTINPPDTDVTGGPDGIPDYSDNCPSIANATQADNDADTQYTANAGFPVIGDVDPSDPATGGDACDTDDDNDGMPDTFENTHAFLDPFNAADATADEDGDGVSNLDEFIAGTDPGTDSVGPVVTAPDDVTVDATGLLTVVDLGTATGVDGNDGDATVLKAAVDLSAADLAALDDPVTGCQVFSDYETDIEPFRPGQHVVTWATCDSSGNSGRDEQIVNVLPLASVSKGQFIGEGQLATVDVFLNGDAPVYPATVDYTVTGTANQTNDHDAVSGTVTFAASGDVGKITFTVTNDGVTEADETIVFTLHSPDNAALGNARRHTVTITEQNLAPQVSLAVTQAAATMGNTIYQPDGNVTIDANANDGNGDTLSFDWSASDATLLAASTVTANQLDIDPSLLTADAFYKVKVSVSDGTTSVMADRLLHLESTVITLTPGIDTDGDLIDDDVEGYGDADADGIPDYLDNGQTPPNAIENQTANLETAVYIETDPGLHIAQGGVAIAAQVSGILVGLNDISSHGGVNGVAVANAATDYTFLSSLLNFEVSGLNDDIESIDVVIPLQSAIQQGAVYRKFNSSGWFTFVEDDKNELRSAAGSGGTCPQPGSSLYSSGLIAGNLCLQLTIQDGGANDADGVRNYVVKDPGGLALEPVEEVEDNAAANANGRIGSMNIWFMLMMSLLLPALWCRRNRCG